MRNRKGLIFDSQLPERRLMHYVLRSVLCSARELGLVVLLSWSAYNWWVWVCAAPGCQTSRKAALTSDTFFASFVSFNLVSGIFQLLTPHHHLRIFAPTLWPLNLADLFQCRQPLRMSVHTTPCAKHMRTCNGSVNVAP